MEAEDPKARLKELYLPTTKEFVVVDVPEMQFAMIDGEGSPDDDRFKHSVRWLFSTIRPIRPIAKERMGKDFVEPPLEGLWWADDMDDLIAGHKDKLKWRLMIVMAEWVDRDMFERGVATASERLGDVPDGLRLERFDEGRSVQIMYVGDYSRGPRRSPGGCTRSSSPGTISRPTGTTMRSTSAIPPASLRRRWGRWCASRCGDGPAADQGLT